MTSSIITTTRAVAGSAADAFDAWTDPERMAAWWWPHLPDARYALDARPGGEFRIEAPSAGIGARGTYRVVEPPQRLTFSWIWISDGTDATVDGQPVVDEVEVVITPDGPDRSVVTVHHTSDHHVPDGGAERGWADCLDRLATLGAAELA